FSYGEILIPRSEVSPAPIRVRVLQSSCPPLSVPSIGCGSDGLRGTRGAARDPSAPVHRPWREGSLRRSRGRAPASLPFGGEGGADSPASGWTPPGGPSGRRTHRSN